MFEHFGPRHGRRLPGYTAVSIALHAAFVAFILGLAALKAREPARKQVEVAFIGPGKSKAPPPPPPPAGKKRITPKRKPVARIEVPKMVEPTRIIEPFHQEAPDEEDEAEEGGVEGGVAGGVVGGVVGGQLGSTGGGGVAAPAERAKPKNVPIFVIQRDMIRQVSPRMSEVFNLQHRGQTVTGMYKVCVDTDGSVYEVTPVKSLAGADDEIVEGIKGGWLYKPQQVPVCFLYNMVVSVGQ
jgi:protein TonB